MTASPGTVHRPNSVSSLPQQLQQAQAFGHRLQQFQVQAKPTEPGATIASNWHVRTLQQPGQPLTIQRQVDSEQSQSVNRDQSSAPAPPVQFFISKLIGSLISPILNILFGGGGGDSGGGGPEEASGGGADF